MKNAFFWGIACWNSSKITKFGNFHSFLAIFDRFLIFANFFVIFGKKILKRGQMSWNWCQPLGTHDFWAKIGSRAKIDGGARGAPPCLWQGLLDVALIRVNWHRDNAQCSYRQSHALLVKIPRISYDAPTIKFSRF